MDEGLGWNRWWGCLLGAGGRTSSWSGLVSWVIGCLTESRWGIRLNRGSLLTSIEGRGSGALAGEGGRGHAVLPLAALEHLAHGCCSQLASISERGRDEGAPSEEGSGVDPVPTPPCPPPAVGAAAAGGGGGGGGEAAVVASSRASVAAAGGDGGSCDRQGDEDGSWAVGRGSGSCCSFLP